jgi:hypothetical protein
MESSFQKAVMQITSSETIEILLDTQRFCAMLGDLVPQQQKECKMVKFAFEFGIGKEIVSIQESPASERSLGRQRIEKRLLEDVGLSEDRTAFLLTNLFDPLAWIGVSETIYKAYMKAESGDINGAYEYGCILLAGKDTAMDVHEAAHWFTIAADKGVADAHHKLGVLYALGVGVVKDYAKAFEHTQKAANQGLVKSTYNLAIFYANGVGTAPDDLKATEYLEIAVNHGDAKAMNKLAWFLEHGIGIQQDCKKAADLYRRSFIKNAENPDPYFNLARLYDEGLGVEKDEGKAGQLRTLASQRSSTDLENEIALIMATV